MAIIQINLWICEFCGTTETVTQETSPYSDPVVLPPNGIEWEYMPHDGEHKLACPRCTDKLKELAI